MKLIAPALQYLKTDLRSLSDHPSEWLLDHYTRFKESRDTFEEQCAFDFETKTHYLGSVDYVLLKLATCLKARPDLSQIGANAANIVSSYTEPEYEAVTKLDELSLPSYMTAREVADALAQREGPTYAKIKDWYQRQLLQYDQIINQRGEKKEIRDSLVKALLKEYNQRLEVLGKGLNEYARLHPTAPLKLLETKGQQTAGTIVNIGMVGQIIGQVSGDVVGQGAVKSEIKDSVVMRSQIGGAQPSSAQPEFKVCPYCGRELDLPKPPKFCPFCREPLSQ